MFPWKRRKVGAGENRQGGLIRGGRERNERGGVVRKGSSFVTCLRRWEEGMGREGGISRNDGEKVCVPVASSSSYSLALVHKLLPITSMSLASLLTKVFISLHSINYHPISCSHSGTAAVMHSIKSVHLANPDTYMFAILP